MLFQFKQMSHKQERDHAVVLGGSIAGLVTARVLSCYFNRVTLVERDRFHQQATPRKGVPQGCHSHILQLRGEQIISMLFPGLIPDLIEAGAIRLDFGHDFLWFQEGVHKIRYPSKITSVCMSRPLLEYHLSRHVQAIANLTCLQEHSVTGLVASLDRESITGVKVQSKATSSVSQTLEADLIVDATGRHSQSPKWLKLLGFSPIKETTVESNLGYTTCVYQHNADLQPSVGAIITLPTLPHGTRGGYLVPIEDNRWIVTLIGWHNDYPSANPEAFLKFAESLPTQDIYNVISKAKPLTKLERYQFPSNQRYHYELMPRMPKGYLVLGDAVCSFNPVLGQGMSVSLLEAMALDSCLKQTEFQSTLFGLEAQYFKKVSRIVADPWLMTAGVVAKPNTRPKALLVSLINWYVSQIHKATSTNLDVASACLHVTAMQWPPHTLIRPDLLIQVLWLTYRRSLLKSYENRHRLMKKWAICLKTRLGNVFSYQNYIKY